MEICLTQVDSGRTRNVSDSVARRFWYQFQFESLVSRKLVSGRACVTTASKYRFPAIQARRRRPANKPQPVSDHFVSTLLRVTPTKVRRRLHNEEFYAKDNLCVPLLSIEKFPFSLDKTANYWNR
ncbi:hypothetical protein AVEN_133268-1 [Araneus ventricosus]|uniref:Uncharacterized protein n=1 Tax=Araneus ventricosus TaxID=182803 RepID=A0A4Y2DLB5_ARAVE|nr:hypothetical protein AVEN_133268-1 [Araneus ventricosus]